MSWIGSVCVPHSMVQAPSDTVWISSDIGRLYWRCSGLEVLRCGFVHQNTCRWHMCNRVMESVWMGGRQTQLLFHDLTWQSKNAFRFLMAYIASYWWHIVSSTMRCLSVERKCANCATKYWKLCLKPFLCSFTIRFGPITQTLSLWSCLQQYQGTVSYLFYCWSHMRQGKTDGPVPKNVGLSLLQSMHLSKKWAAAPNEDVVEGWFDKFKSCTLAPLTHLLVIGFGIVGCALGSLQNPSLPIWCLESEWGQFCWFWWWAHHSDGSLQGHKSILYTFHCSFRKFVPMLVSVRFSGSMLHCEWRWKHLPSVWGQLRWRQWRLHWLGGLSVMGNVTDDVIVGVLALGESDLREKCLWSL